MPVIESNGIRLAYDTLGNRKHEPVLLIAGLGLQLISWPEEFCRTLAAQGFYVIRFDNRDSGLSTKMDQLGKPDLAMAFMKSMFHMPILSGYTLYDMAKDATGLLDALEIPKAHIVGASMGGMIAQIIAGTAPHRTLTLTSIMSTSGRPGLPGPTMAANSALLSRPSNPRDINSVIDHFVRTFRVLGSPGYPTPEPVLRRQVEASIRRNICPAGTARQLLAIAASGDRVAMLDTIRARTLVIHGTDDPLVPIACGRDTARLVRGAILHEIKGMGHDIPPALEAGLAQLIGAHLKGELIEHAGNA
ncbi:MAG TPA: alpha/beta hydrolase [Noviherbaspirillum sp.]|uniref:alpha/beta fold hydrolase n=1 Tax=Noviherbaspirillum sp. TaxID=1926288 RepID=UPI002DDCB8E4|nr:alpha/beta hydrolase [Noviherbaspirillum sp.]HEV2611246.1 alpha/beta hydrolase [Noviherbaspirillum sp.]